MSYEDVMALEEGGLDELEAAKAMQRLINSGTAWSLQGSYGRSAMDGIKSGRNMVGAVAHRDYYGNRVPARGDLKPGSFGTREFVAERMGEDYAAAIESA